MKIILTREIKRRVAQRTLNSAEINIQNNAVSVAPKTRENIATVSRKRKAWSGYWGTSVSKNFDETVTT